MPSEGILVFTFFVFQINDSFSKTEKEGDRGKRGWGNKKIVGYKGLEDGQWPTRMDNNRHETTLKGVLNRCKKIKLLLVNLMLFKQDEKYSISRWLQKLTRLKTQYNISCYVLIWPLLFMFVTRGNAAAFLDKAHAFRSKQRLRKYVVYFGAD